MHPNILLLALIAFIIVTIHSFLLHSSSNFSTLISAKYTPLIINHKYIVFSALWCIPLSIFSYIITRPRKIYLLNYSCHLPEKDRRCSLEVCEYFGNRSKRFTETSADFMRAIYSKSGLGDETYGPPFVFQTDYEAKLKNAVIEAEETMFTAVSSVLSKTSTHCSKITHLIVVCSMYSPSPSLASMVVNRFGLEESVKSYNLSGMGCSAGTVAIDMAAHLLKREIGYALIVATENTSLNWYFGDNRHMLVTNCIFRVGSAAALITNDPHARHQSKLELVSTLRTHHGADDAAYNAATQQEDEKGTLGVALTQDLVRVAGAGLKNHISTLGPHVLPMSQLLKYAFNVLRSYFSKDGKGVGVPDFTTAFEHICIHAGGKAVINSISRIMKFEEKVVEPARMCLHRFGNTSSSLVFYELAYFEGKKRIKEGDRVWMLAFGTGFKACSLVWRAARDSWMDNDNPWTECIHRYPVY